MTYRIGIIGTGAAPTETKVPPAPIAEIAAQGFTPELIEPRLRTFPMTPYDRGLTALAYVDCAVEAEKAGFDAVFINTVGDYGIDETKSATNMAPVGPDIAERVSVSVCRVHAHRLQDRGSAAYIARSPQPRRFPQTQSGQSHRRRHPVRRAGQCGLRRRLRSVRDRPGSG